MDITVRLSDREISFLRKMINRQKNISREEYSIEDAAHECIRDSMFDEG